MTKLENKNIGIMALTSCPECGKRKLSKALSKVLLALIFVIVIIGGGWYFWKSPDDGYSLEGLAKALPKYIMVGEFHCGRASVIKSEL